MRRPQATGSGGPWDRRGGGGQVAGPTGSGGPLRPLGVAFFQEGLQALHGGVGGTGGGAAGGAAGELDQ